MKIIHTELEVGATQPFRIVHISDTHLTLADSRDDERKRELSLRRAEIFPDSEEMLRMASQQSELLGAPIFHTGDLIDFVTEANLDRAFEFMQSHDCFFCTGNHEFCQYMDAVKEDAAYRDQSLDRVQRSFTNNIRMDSRVINGVNFVALDDGYYLFEPLQVAFLKQQVARGLPIVLLLHNPIFEDKLYDDFLNHREELGLPPSTSRCAWMVAVPEEKMSHYTPDRFAQQYADDLTRETVAYIKNEPMIKAIIAGHLHCDHEGRLTQTISQLVTSNYTVRILHIT